MTGRKRHHFHLAVHSLAVFCFALWMVAAGVAASGQGRHLGQEKKSHGDEDEQGEHSEHGEHGRGKGHRAHQFEAREREMISGYYANPGRGLPPGLAKRGGNLPPGLEKHLMRNGTLPPGLQKRLEPLPVELERRLPPIPVDCGCHRGIIGLNVVLVRNGSYFVLDVLHIGAGE
jgi:hypothetical protein